MKKVTLLVLVLVGMASCSDNYSNGKRVGYLTKFSEKGIIWKSWEGSLNMTQTGMNSNGSFDFSVDNNVNNPKVINNLKLAMDSSFKCELTYHESKGMNWFSNRGETNYFVTKVQFLK